jgi:ketosteroid isomerase-like protein
MSAEDNLKIVKGIYEAFGTGDVAAILEVVDDEVDWAAETTSDVAPWYGKATDKDGVAGFFAAIGGAVDVLDFEPLSFAANDDDEVMVRLRFAMKSKQTGREARMGLQHYWRLRDGKVSVYRGTEDTAQTAAMLAS